MKNGTETATTDKIYEMMSWQNRYQVTCDTNKAVEDSEA